MATRLLYQEDSYIREFTSSVARVEGDRVYLNETAFHPGPHGGLDTDTGFLEVSGRRVRVLGAVMEEGWVAHRVEDPAPFRPGVSVRGVIDWGRRYRMMRLHTFSHILASILYEKYGVLVTGGHISPEYARDDFSLESGEWKEILREAFEEANRVASRCIEVRVYWLPREEALKIPGIVKLAGRLPPGLDTLRIVEIPGVDVQADGGPHVRNTCEIGEVVVYRTESRGRRRKRVYYTLKEGG